MRMLTTKTSPLQPRRRRTTRRRPLRNPRPLSSPLARKLRRLQRRQPSSRRRCRANNQLRRHPPKAQRGTHLPLVLSRRNQLRRPPRLPERSAKDRPRSLLRPPQHLPLRLLRAPPPNLPPTPRPLRPARRLQLPSPVGDAPSLGSARASSKPHSAEPALAGALRGAVKASPILRTRTRRKRSPPRMRCQRRPSTLLERRRLRGLRPF